MSTCTRVSRIMLKFAGCWAVAFVIALVVGNYIDSASLGGVLGVLVAVFACLIAAVWTEKERYP